MKSQQFKEATMELSTRKIPLVLIELNETTWTNPIRIVANTSNITSNGNVYYATGFKYTPPATGGKGTKLVMEDVLREYINRLTGQLGDITAKASVILADNPDEVELGPWDFYIKDIGIKGQQVTLNLTSNSILRNSLAGAPVDDTVFPGLYV